MKNSFEYDAHGRKLSARGIAKKRARQRKRIIRIALVGAILLVIAGAVVTGMVFGIRALIKGTGEEPVGNPSETVSEMVDIEKIPEPTPTPTPTPKPPGLGQRETQEGEPVLVDGRIEVFPGYKCHTDGDTYTDESADLKSDYAILIDARTGSVVCQRTGFVRINPASMTKILTVLVAAEHLTKEDLTQKVIISADDTYYAYKNDLSSVGFSNEEEVTVEDLFYGTILPSGADAAHALAVYVAGNEENFVELMNERVKEMGLESTHFTNCVGSFDENHYTTCAEMAMILKAAVENDYCYKVLNAHKYTTSKTPPHPDGIEISNWFLRRIEDKDTKGEVLCAKTGFVNQSGSCAASFSLQDSGEAYFCVTAKAHSSWRAIYDHVDILANETK